MKQWRLHWPTACTSPVVGGGGHLDGPYSGSIISTVLYIVRWRRPMLNASKVSIVDMVRALANARSVRPPLVAQQKNNG